MARFVADFLPLNGTSFFNMSGEMAPQLRVFFSVPNDVDGGLFKYDRGTDKAEAKERFENQDKLKNVLIERYRDLVQTRLQALRRNKNLSTIGIYKQSIDLEKGARMDYESLWGREYVSLFFSEELVRKLIEKMNSSGRCMLIMYEGNKIAWMPMEAIGSPKLAFSKKKLNQSRWWTDSDARYQNLWLYAKSTQLRFGPTTHIACISGMIFGADGVVKTDENKDRLYFYNTTNSILGAGTVAPDDGRSPMWGNGNPPSVVFNGNTKRIYDGLGRTYNIVKGKVVYESSVKDWLADTTTSAPVFPSASGDLFCSSHHMSAVYGVLGNNIGLFSNQQDQIVGAAAPYPVVHARSWWGGPNASSVWFEYMTFYEAGGVISDHVLVYSNDGKVDKVDVKIVPFAWNDVYPTQAVGGIWTYAGITGYAMRFDTVDGPSTFTGGGDIFNEVVPTYHLGTDAKDMYVSYFPWSPPGVFGDAWAIYNPYTGRQTRKDTVGVSINTGNGKHFLQLYRYFSRTRDEDHPKLAIDRKDVTAQYAAALGVTSLAGIDCILFDVKKSDIDKLK